MCAHVCACVRAHSPACIRAYIGVREPKRTPSFFISNPIYFLHTEMGNGQKRILIHIITVWSETGTPGHGVDH